MNNQENYLSHVEQSASSAIQSYLAMVTPQNVDEQAFCMSRLCMVSLLGFLGNAGTDATLLLLKDLIEVVETQPKIEPRVEEDADTETKS